MEKDRNHLYFKNEFFKKGNMYLISYSKRVVGSN